MSPVIVTLAISFFLPLCGVIIALSYVVLASAGHPHVWRVEHALRDMRVRDTTQAKVIYMRARDSRGSLLVAHRRTVIYSHPAPRSMLALVGAALAILVISAPTETAQASEAPNRELNIQHSAETIEVKCEPVSKDDQRLKCTETVTSGPNKGSEQVFYVGLWATIAS